MESVVLKLGLRSSVSNAYAQRLAGGLNKTAFTLIELLVVVAIISLLVSILMPSLRIARDLAKQATCMANQRGLASGIYIYADDYDGIVVPFYSIDRSGWYRNLVADAKKYPYNTAGYVDGYETLFCPAHEVPPSINPAHYPDRYDYAVNLGYISYALTPGTVYDYGAIGYPVSICNLGSIANAAGMIMLVDSSYGGTLGDEYGSFYIMTYWAPTNENHAYIRHFGSCNVAWMDSHVVPIKATDPDDPETIYDPEALTHTGITPNYWDRK